MDEDHSATQAFENLLGEHPDAAEKEPLNDHPKGDDERSDDQMDVMIDLDASDVEGASLEDTVDDLDESIFEEALKTPEDTSGKTIVLDAEHTATQELDSLLSAFSDDDEEEEKKD